MPIPDYETLMAPLLHLVSEGEMVYSDAVKRLSDEFSLSQEERSQLKSGKSTQTLIANRVGWAKSFLGKAKLLDFPRRTLMCITDRGREVVQSAPKHIDYAFLMQFPEFRQWRDESKSKKSNKNRLLALSSHETAHDVSSWPEFKQAVSEAETGGAFDPVDNEDARKKILAAIVRRQGQQSFRKKLLLAYGGRCAVTGCQIEVVLEAAHIVPYRGQKTNHVSNGLLLRADLHTLFDLGLIAVDPKSKSLIVASVLLTTDYGQWHEKQIRLPPLSKDHPSEEALRMHRKRAKV